ncbi:MAG: neutral/alkaline non-lysosomal ceramidase N-terminal domain-containing protein [Caldilineaceae bacterium]
MKAGVAEIDITPPVGTDMTGFIAREGSSIGVLDPLFARALILDDGATQAAIITCDLLGLHLSFVNEVRSTIAATTGIPAAHILVTCSHTHAGPATLFLQDCGVIDAAYMARLHHALVEVTQTAFDARRSATLTVGHGNVTANVHNRRTPGDVIDPDLAILHISDEQGTPFAILLNYACHPTCLQAENRLFSAEYPGIAVRKVAAATKAITLFVTGAIGDVGPVTRGMETMQSLGEAIGDEALRLLGEEIKNHKKDEIHEKLVVGREELSLPLLSSPSLEWWEAEAKRWQEMQVAPDVPLLPSHPRIPIAMRNWSSRMRDLTQQGTIPSNVNTEVQVIRLGEIAFISAPGELFVELGLAIKSAAPIPHIFLCGFGNDDVGYIPTRWAYPKGGYEIAEAYKYYGYPTALAPEAGEQVVATVARIFKGQV